MKQKFNVKTKWRIFHCKHHLKHTTFNDCLKRKPSFERQHWSWTGTQSIYTSNDFPLIFAGSVFIPKSWCCWWGNPYGWGNSSCCPISSWYVSAHFLLSCFGLPLNFQCTNPLEEGEVFCNHVGSSNAGILTFFCLTITLHGLLLNISYSTTLLYSMVGNCLRFHSNWSSKIIPFEQTIDYIITAEKSLKISIYFVLFYVLWVTWKQGKCFS